MTRLASLRMFTTSYAHLNTDGDIHNDNDALPNKPPVYVLHHRYNNDQHKRQYTGIDCSAFCQRVAREAGISSGAL